MVRRITTWSYLEPLLYKNEFMHLADLSKKIKKPHSTVRKYLNYFERLGILNKKKQGRLTMYRMNQNNNIIDYIVLAEKEKLLMLCERDKLLKEFINMLHENLKEGNNAIIFGSSLNSTKKANDIDILITGKIEFEDKINNFEKIFSKSIHLINTKSLNDINITLKEEIRKSHLIVHGSEEVVKWLL